MQKVTYINLRGERIVFGGEKPLILAHVDGLGPTAMSTMRIQGAYQQGETITRMQHASREIEIHFSIHPQSNTREALYYARLELSAKLAAGRCIDAQGQMGQLIYENDVGTWFVHAVPEGEGATFGTRRQNRLPEGKIRFRAGSAYWLSSQNNSAVLEMGGGGFSLPFSFPIRFGQQRFAIAVHNVGGVDAPVRMTIYGTGEAPEIRNHTTGALLSVRTAVATGERLQIDTDPEQISCVLERADGSREDAFGYLDPQSALSAFVLRPGENEIEYVPSRASDASRVEMSWYTRYEGV